jgi:hypothetical protein
MRAATPIDVFRSGYVWSLPDRHAAVTPGDAGLTCYSAAGDAMPSGAWASGSAGWMT